MAIKAVYGISNAKMGITGVNGAMGTVLTDVTPIAADSVNIAFPEPTETEIVPEDYEDALAVLEEQGVKTVELDCMNVSTDNLALLFGGSATAGKFTPGVAFVLPEQSFQFTTRPLNGTKQTWSFPRTKLTVSITANPSKKNTLNLHFKFSILAPTDATGKKLPSWMVEEIED